MPETKATYDDVRALFVDCTDERDPSPGYLAARIATSRFLMERQRALVDVLPAAALEPFGWSLAYAPVLAADILVIAVPAQPSGAGSAASAVIERLRRCFAMVNGAGTGPRPARVGGCLRVCDGRPPRSAQDAVDGLRALGYGVPPSGDGTWSVADNRRLTLLTWDLLHMARTQKDARRALVVPADQAAGPRWSVTNRPYRWTAIRPRRPAYGADAG